MFRRQLKWLFCGTTVERKVAGKEERGISSFISFLKRGKKKEKEFVNSDLKSFLSSAATFLPLFGWPNGALLGRKMGFYPDTAEVEEEAFYGFPRMRESPI